MIPGSRVWLYWLACLLFIICFIALSVWATEWWKWRKERH